MSEGWVMLALELAVAVREASTGLVAVTLLVVFVVLAFVLLPREAKARFL